MFFCSFQMHQSPPGVFEETDINDKLPSSITIKIDGNRLVKVLSVIFDDTKSKISETKSVFLFDFGI